MTLPSLYRNTAAKSSKNGESFTSSSHLLKSTLPRARSASFSSLSEKEASGSALSGILTLDRSTDGGSDMAPTYAWSRAFSSPMERDRGKKRR